LNLSACFPDLLLPFSWGRILAATGSVPFQAQTGSSPLNPSTVSVSFVPSDGTTPLQVLSNGEPEKVDEDRAKEIMVQDEFQILVDLKMGDAEATYYTCDFSYVSILLFVSF
jgi:glutamate N-acetyltransferase / amino-acid N-acetyltransferase